MFHRIYLILILLVGFAFFGLPAQAKEVVEQLIEMEIDSKILDEKRKILIQLPSSYENNKGAKYPVLYQIDGPRLLDQAKQTIDVSVKNNLAPEVIIVGIANTVRSRDLVPHVDKKRNFPQGGSDKFLGFIEKELIPYIDKNYRTQPFKILSGHSFGGLFTVYALYTRPELFQAHFAFSPSLQWADLKTAKEASRFFDSNKNLNNFLYANIGNEGGNMQKGFDLLRQSVKDNGSNSLRYKFNDLPDETHMSVTFMGQYLAFKELYKDWSFDPENVEGDVFKAIDKHYEKLSKRYGYKVAAPEATLNNAGYIYLYEFKKVETAIKIFEKNIKAYPNSANAHDSLSEALSVANKNRLALKAVEKAISLTEKTNRRYQTYINRKENIIKKMSSAKAE